MILAMKWHPFQACLINCRVEVATQSCGLFRADGIKNWVPEGSLAGIFVQGTPTLSPGDQF